MKKNKPTAERCQMAASPARSPVAPLRGLPIAVAAALAGSATPVGALSFGTEQVSSYLGQPFVATIPLLGSSGDALEARCFRLSHSQRNDGIGSLLNGRVELQTSSRAPQLIVRSLRPVDDPVLSFALESVCDTPIRREYTVLLDPPPVRAASVTPPVSAASSSSPAPSAPPAATAAVADGTSSARAPVGNDAATASARGSGAARDRGSAGAATSVAPKRAPPPKPPVSRGSAGQRPAPPVAKVQPTPAGDRLRVQAAADASGSPIADASLAALAIPRLRISSDLTSPQPGAAGAVGTTAPADELGAAIAKDRRARLLAAPIEEDLAPRLEADLVVARRRLAEMQAQLTAAGATPPAASAPAAAAAPSSAETAKKAAPPAAPAPAADSGWDWQEWIWVPAVALVAGLLAFLLRQRRVQREQKRFAAEPPITIVQTTAADTRFTGLATGATATRTVTDPQFAQTSTRFPSTAPQTLTQTAPFPITHTQTNTEAERTAKALSEASERLNSPLFQPSDTASHVDVSELSQATDEAQVYADLGRNEQAIEILRAHIDAQTGDRTSPAPWLMIFDLYRRTNNRSGYDQLAPLFRKRFNGRMPDWETYGHELALDDGLEAFPHLVARLERTWGTPDARKFLEDLLYDNRGGSRLGFSLAAYRDILLLLQLHDTLASEPNPLDSVDWESRGANDADGTPKWDLALDMVEPPANNELDEFKRGLPPRDKN
ncbi:MAG: hypothetical protein JNL19_03660 [Burkholderiales bacterium]|nr:hypothetical protein [Burkholderiales bacterium]